MKKLFTFLILILISSGVWGQVDIWNHTFETSGGYSTDITELTDGGYDYFIRTDGTNIGSGVVLSNIQGSYYFAAQDIDGDQPTLPVTLIFNDIDISSYSSLTFYVYLAEDDDGSNQDWDAPDYVHIDYDIDNSGSFTNLVHVEASADLTNQEPAIDTNFDGTGDGTTITSAFTEFSNSITGTGSTIDIRVTFNLDSGDEDIALDNFRITGLSSGGVANPTSFAASAGSTSDIDLSWTLNGNSDDVMVAYNTSNTFGVPSGSYSVGEPIGGGGTVIYNGSGVGYNHSGLSANTTYYYKAWSVDGTTTYSAGTETNATTTKAEPTNHVTNSAAAVGSPSHSAIDVTWDDATGGTVPDGYLIKGSDVDAGSIANPVDGTEEVDGGLILNVSAGVGTASFSSLNSETTYYFKIFPYTNSGSHIDYKIDGTVPEISVTTDVFSATLLLEENFDFAGNLTDNSWVAHSGGGTNPIGTTTGLTYTDYPSSGIGNAATVVVSGEDDNRTFTQMTSGNIYVSFMVNVSSASISGDYFFHLSSNPLASYSGRIFALDDGAGNLKFGIAKASTAANYASGNYLYNTTYLIVLKYTFNSGTDDDIVGIYINPSLAGSEPVSFDAEGTSSETDATGIGSVALRQGTNCPVLVIDGIRVSDSWDQAPLPVELTSFTAIANGNAVNLKWKTATEVDNYGFEIERSTVTSSTSATVWQKIAFVEGAGNSNSPKEYSYTDASVVSGKYTYRLKQVDIDGQFQYSNEVEAEIAAPAKYSLAQNYPNPFNPTTVISYQLPENGMVNLTVYDVLGNEVSNLVNETQEAGKYQVKFNASNLASGIYFYKLSAGNFTSIKKLMLLK